MVVRFRKKVVKKRGSRTYGYGSPKKHRGKGSKGGKGKAGVGKKAGHKAIFLREQGHVLGKRGFKVPKESKTNYYVFSLKSLYDNLKLLEDKGYVKKEKVGYVIDLVRFKKLPVKLVLANSSDSLKFFEGTRGSITVSKVTKGVKTFLEEKGWEVILEGEAKNEEKVEA